MTTSYVNAVAITSPGGTTWVSINDAGVVDLEFDDMPDVYFYQETAVLVAQAILGLVTSFKNAAEIAEKEAYRQRELAEAAAWADEGMPDVLFDAAFDEAIAAQQAVDGCTDTYTSDASEAWDDVVEALDVYEHLTGISLKIVLTEEGAGSV